MRFSSLKHIGITICCTIGFALLGGGAVTAYATNTGSQSGSVFITAFSPGEAGCATCEFIEITNTANRDIDVTGWRFEYRPAAANSTIYRLKVITADQATRVVLPAGAREALFDTARAQPGMVTFLARMADKGGALYLRDASGVLVDMVGWGDSAHAAGEPATKSDSGWYVRSSATGNNQADFRSVEAGSYALTYGSLQEIVDVCANIDGVQEEPPAGTRQQPDGSCVEVDQCPNLSGVQEAVPPGYRKQNGACQPRELPKLRLNEVLANPKGVDTGVEYIELYNPTDAAIALSEYTITVNGKRFSLPDTELAPGMFFVTTSIVLTNSGGTIVVQDALTDVVIDKTDYPVAKDDIAWAFSDEQAEWKLTSLPTPGATNAFPVVTEDEADDQGASTLTPCRADQYRNPLTNRCKKRQTPTALAACPADKVRNPATNRCRNASAAQSTLKPCRPDQYRNPATNRCRNVASTASTLTPCRADQYRNPATNRCRKISASSSSLKPCQSGQERNPATNRCRKARGTATLASSDFPVESVATTSNTKLGWWIAGGIVVAGSAIVGWSRRDQFLRLLRRVLPGD